MSKYAQILENFMARVLVFEDNYLNSTHLQKVLPGIKGFMGVPSVAMLAPAVLYVAQR
jgi:hypothetical protein